MVYGGSQTQSNLLYGAAGVAAGATAEMVARKIDSAYKMAAGALGIGVVLAVLEVVSSSDLNACMQTATNIQSNVAAIVIQTASTQTAAGIEANFQQMRQQLGLLAANQAQTAYAANIFAWTPPTQQSFPLQSAAITTTTTTQASNSSTAVVVLGLVIIAGLVLFLV